MNGLEAVHEALRHMRREGVDRVFVSDAALESLRSAAPEKPAPEPAKLEIPVEPAARASAPKPAKPAPAPRTPPLPPPPAEPEPPAGTAAERLAWLEDTVLNCPTCREHLSKHGKIVFGAGSAEADIFFCGEAPGADEERSGSPFVGKAGQLLTKIIEAMGLRRGEVYIANILKWRPEHDKPYGNRPPTREEMEFCLPYLRAQLNIIRPKVIVALGNTAVTGLLGPDPERRMGQVRGTWQSFNNTPLMITFHPSYLLRNNTLKTKRQVWEDLLQVMDKVGLPISEKQQGFFLPKG